MPTIRLPLMALVEAREYDSTKDTNLVNGYLEQEFEDLVRAVKRPGLSEQVAAANVGYAIFAYDTTVFIFHAGNTATTPAQYPISSLV